MRCFVDTSAFIALLNADDEAHARAASRWRRLLSDDVDLLTSNYVALETFTLSQRRMGIAAARDFHHVLLPVVSMIWVDEEVHNTAASFVILSRKRGVSVVDYVSFEIMRRLGIDKAFAYDRHFRDQGFELLG